MVVKCGDRVSRRGEGELATVESKIHNVVYLRKPNGVVYTADTSECRLVETFPDATPVLRFRVENDVGCEYLFGRLPTEQQYSMTDCDQYAYQTTNIDRLIIELVKLADNYYFRTMSNPAITHEGGTDVSLGTFCENIDYLRMNELAVYLKFLYMMKTTATGDLGTDLPPRGCLIIAGNDQLPDIIDWVTVDYLSAFVTNNPDTIALARLLDYPVMTYNEDLSLEDTND